MMLVPDIRPALAGDAAAIAPVHWAIFQTDQWNEAFWLAAIADPQIIVLVAADGDAVAGFVAARCAADEAEILTLGVAPSFRRQGVGAALLAALHEKAAEKGAVRLFLEVAADNGPARVLYEAVGYEVIGRRAKYYANGADAVTMSCQLVTAG